MSSDYMIAQVARQPAKGQALKLDGNTVSQPSRLDPRQVSPGNTFGNILNEIQSNKPNPFTAQNPVAGSKPGFSIR